MIDLIVRLIWNSHTRGLVLFILSKLPVLYDNVLCICWGGNKYSCNPKAITDEILRRKANGEKMPRVFYAFNNVELFTSDLPKEITPIKLGSLRFYFILATSRFVISNTRVSSITWPFPKKKGQYYFQTMHGGHGLKRQELEVSDSLSDEYIQMLHEDAARIDLMISDSAFWTKLARTIFAYPKGEILECGLPRNDIFFDEKQKKTCRKATEDYVISEKSHSGDRSQMKFLVYCPTFRNNGRKDVYGFDVDRLVTVLEQRFGGQWFILVSSHPNMLSFYQEIYDFDHPRMVDVGQKDLQPILVSGDAAITDYSSAGFEFALTEKPVFLLMRDIADYDRGIYFDPKELPFPFAENEESLVINIESFDLNQYKERLSAFNKKIIGLNETGQASAAVVEWMISKT